MTLHCYCGWSGDRSELVSATSDWIAEKNVDFDHFSNGKFNCPACGDSGGWRVTGDDDVDVDYPYPDHDDDDDLDEYAFG